MFLFLFLIIRIGLSVLGYVLVVILGLFTCVLTLLHMHRVLRIVDTSEIAVAHFTYERSIELHVVDVI